MLYFKNNSLKKLTGICVAVFLFSSTAACSSIEYYKKLRTASAPVSVKSRVNNSEYFEVYHSNGRFYVFGDKKTYLSFLAHDETPFTLTRIAAGPQRQTLVFGLSKKEKKKRFGIAHVDMYDGKIQGSAESFYGEIVKNDRFYVFDSWNDMKKFRQVGEATFTFTKVGAGPNRSTVIFVRNKKNKKEQPVQLVALFKKIHSIASP